MAMPSSKLDPPLVSAPHFCTTQLFLHEKKSNLIFVGHCLIELWRRDSSDASFVKGSIGRLFGYIIVAGHGSCPTETDVVNLTNQGKRNINISIVTWTKSVILQRMHCEVA